MMTVLQVIVFAIAVFVLIYTITKRHYIKKVVCIRCKKVYSIHKNVPDKECPYCGVKI
jgi:DNA-directed RNA polymerase subunit RPC12/RpoP